MAGAFFRALIRSCTYAFVRLFVYMFMHSCTHGFTGSCTYHVYSPIQASSHVIVSSV